MVRRHNGRAIAELAGVVHFHRQAGQPFDQIFADQTGVIAGATGDDGDFFNRLQPGGAEVEGIQHHALLDKVEPTAYRIGQATPLLEDLFLHVVGELALFRRLRVPVDGGDRLLQRLPVEIRVFNAVAGDDGHLAGLQKGDLAGML